MARIFFSQVGSLWQSISQADPVSIARVEAAAAGSLYRHESIAKLQWAFSSLGRVNELCML